MSSNGHSALYVLHAYAQGLINGEEGMHSNTRFAHGKIQTWRQDILNLVTLGKKSSYSYRNGSSSLQSSPSHGNYRLGTTPEFES